MHLCLCALWWSTGLHRPLWWDQLWWELSDIRSNIFFIFYQATTQIFSLLMWLSENKNIFLYPHLSLSLSLSPHTVLQVRLQLEAFRGCTTRQAQQGDQVSVATVQQVPLASISPVPTVAFLVYLAQGSQVNLDFRRLQAQVKVQLPIKSTFYSVLLFF